MSGSTIPFVLSVTLASIALSPLPALSGEPKALRPGAAMDYGKMAFEPDRWYAAASLAAGRDLSPTFCDRWRLPLSQKARKAAAEIRWKKAGLKIEDVLAAISL